MITPHFPPDSSAGTHRVRLLAPHLPGFGWEPTVLTVDPAFLEGTLDQRLAALVPQDLRVERANAFAVDKSRAFGFGDLGLRSIRGLYTKAVELLKAERYDAIYITIFPAYPALLGSLLKRKFNIPFVLDYQDPWVGAWGKAVGGGRGGAVDFKSRASRRIGLMLEPLAVRSADAMTAVSQRTMDDIAERVPHAASIPRVTIPIGGDEGDFATVRALPMGRQYFDNTDGHFHLCHVGTILPLGIETVRAVLGAVAKVRETRIDLYQSLHIHFLGSSNERNANAPARVLGIARELGIAEIVTEHPARLDYADAIRAQLDASALLLMGSTERHYTASRLFPALLSNRPLLAVYHRSSSVTAMLENRGEAVKLVAFGDEDPPAAHVGHIANALISLMESRHQQRTHGGALLDESFTAHHLAGKLAGVLGQVASNPAGYAR